MHEVVFPLEPLSPPGDTMKPRFLWVLYPNKIVPVICRRFRHRPPLLPRPRRVPFSAEFGSFGLGAFGARRRHIGHVAGVEALCGKGALVRLAWRGPVLTVVCINDLEVQHVRYFHHDGRQQLAVLTCPHGVDFMFHFFNLPRRPRPGRLA